MSLTAHSPIKGVKVLVTGGSNGLGLGIVESLVSHEASVTVLARDKDALLKLKERLAVEIISADVKQDGIAEEVLSRVMPEIVILNAGAIPPMGSIDQISWEDFTHVWEQDVKATFRWVQAAFKVPLVPGCRILLGSSGAAVQGSPLSGSYAGAKRMIWWMANYANGEAQVKKMKLKFQALVPRQLFANTRVGEAGANDYARRRGVTPAEIFAGFDNALTARSYGDQVIEVLTDPKWKDHTVLSFSGAQGITHLDGGI